MSDQDIQRARLQLAVNEANQSKRVVESNIRAEIDRETMRIKSEWAETLRSVTAKLCEAEDDLRHHIDATASHPWEGKAVVRAQSGVKGVVEIRNSATIFPEYITCGIPAQGGAFVRLLKKDGNKGLRFDTLSSSWKLADEVQS